MELFEKIFVDVFFFGLYSPAGCKAHKNMKFVYFIHNCLAHLVT